MNMNTELNIKIHRTAILAHIVLKETKNLKRLCLRLAEDFTLAIRFERLNSEKEEFEMSNRLAVECLPK